MNLDIRESFEKTRIAGSIAAGALDEVSKIISPGITTDQIDKLCYEYINDHGAYSAPLFYRGFPKSCCTSPNHIICHGIPGNKELKEGDIVNVDVTAIKEGLKILCYDCKFLSKGIKLNKPLKFISQWTIYKKSHLKKQE